jgi:hypothetical protein
VSTWTVSAARRSWETSAHDRIRNYQSMTGRVPIPELIAAFEEAGVDWHEVELNYATATWTELPNAEDIADDAERRAQSDARKEAWERETFVRLTAKYGAPPATE